MMNLLSRDQGPLTKSATEPVASTSEASPRTWVRQQGVMGRLGLSALYGTGLDASHLWILGATGFSPVRW
jgi:hypothetical protein